MDKKSFRYKRTICGNLFPLQKYHFLNFNSRIFYFSIFHEKSRNILRHWKMFISDHLQAIFPNLTQKAANIWKCVNQYKSPIKKLNFKNLKILTFRIWEFYLFTIFEKIIVHNKEKIDVWWTKKCIT